MAGLGALLFVTTGLQVATPQILRRFLDGALTGAATADLAALAGAFLLVGLGSYAVGAISTVVAADVGWTATNRLRADLALHCLRLDMGFHNAHRPGELVERIDGDVNALATFFSALVVVKTFIGFIGRHGFAPFAWYRIAFGGVMLGLIVLR